MHVYRRQLAHRLRDVALRRQGQPGGPIQDAPATEWAKHLGLVRKLGFTEVDPTDTWVRVGDLDAARMKEFQQVLDDAGLTVPAISTSRRSVLDPQHGDEYFQYSLRLLDRAAEIGCKMVSYGFFQPFKPAQETALWFWLADGHVDDPARRDEAVAKTQQIADHAAANGQEITLEMYEDTFVGTCDDAVAFLTDVDRPNVGLNPDIPNFVRLHRPMEPIQQMWDKVLPHTNYWHVKSYLRDEDPATGAITTFPTSMEAGIINFRSAITQAVEGGFRGAFLCEHYGGDALGNIARNRDYVRSVLSTIL